MSIKEIRQSLNLTQKEASEIIEMPLRTYVNYENDPSKKETIKYRYIKEKLHEYGHVDETHGILSIEKIKDSCSTVFSHYNVDYAFLFGSYSKGEAQDDSDIDLFVSTDVSGIKFYGMVEELRQVLHKKIDMITLESLENNTELMNEILKDGIKIYES